MSTETVIVRVSAAQIPSAAQAKKTMISENPEYQFRGLRPRPIRGEWVGLMEKKAFGSMPPVHDVMDTTNTVDTYPGPGDTDLDDMSPLDDAAGAPAPEGDTLSQIKDMLSQISDMVSQLTGDDGGDDDGDDFGGDDSDWDDDDDDSFDPDGDGDDDSSEEDNTDEDYDAPSKNKNPFTSSNVRPQYVKMTRPREEGMTVRQARAEVIRETASDRELTRFYRLASVEENDNNFVALFELKAKVKNGTPSYRNNPNNRKQAKKRRRR